jgi:bifunctional enzyme CysN/CysC
MHLEEVHRVMDAAELSVSQRQDVKRHEVAECTFKLSRAAAFDTAAVLPATARFVIVDDFEICGGGLVREALEDRQAWMRDKVLLRNRKWEASAVAPQARAERFGQLPALLVITGPRALDRKSLARALEASLFAAGRAVYFLGIGNLLYGVDADLPREPSHRLEHLRRLAEVANIVLDAGLLLVVTAAELTQDEVELLLTGLAGHRVEVTWLGEAITTDLACDFLLSPAESTAAHVTRLQQRLTERGVLLPALAEGG